MEFYINTIKYNNITYYQTKYKHYLVSKCGSVLSTKPRANNKNEYSKPRKIRGSVKTYEKYLVLDIKDENNKRKQVTVHRLILETFTGKSYEIIDHKNGDRQDNRLCNLRWSTILDNAANKKQHRNGKLIGTSYDSSRKKPWRAQICINYKTINLGYYKSEIEAHQAYLKADDVRCKNQTVQRLVKIRTLK